MRAHSASPASSALTCQLQGKEQHPRHRVWSHSGESGQLSCPFFFDSSEGNREVRNVHPAELCCTAKSPEAQWSGVEMCAKLLGFAGIRKNYTTGIGLPTRDLLGPRGRAGPPIQAIPAELPPGGGWFRDATFWGQFWFPKNSGASLCRVLWSHRTFLPPPTPRRCNQSKNAGC